MSYVKLTEKVRQAEQALEARERIVVANWRVTKQNWKEAWTPGRITAAGAIAGFMYGLSRQRRGSSGGGTLRLASSLIGLVTSLQAKSAAHDVEDAAKAAEQNVAGNAAQVAQAPASPAPAPRWSNPPTAAAAATELSEP